VVALQYGDVDFGILGGLKVYVPIAFKYQFEVKIIAIKLRDFRNVAGHDNWIIRRALHGHRLLVK